MRIVRSRACVAAIPLATLWWLSSCHSSPGYRDQAMYALSQGGERTGDHRLGAVPWDAVQLDEFLSAYEFDLPAHPGAPLTGRLVVGGTGTDREKGRAYLMLALSAPRLGEASLPPRSWAIALDTSHSMRDGNRWRLATSAVSRLVARMRPCDRVTLITFDDQATVRLQWARPAEAQQAIADLAANPRTGKNGHEKGLAALDQVLWEARRDGVTASGFFVSELEGAPDDLPSALEASRKAGADVNVIGLAGGNETLLRQLARSGGGTGAYVFLDDEGAIERTFGARLSETFDSVVSDVTVRVLPCDGFALDSAEDSREVLEANRGWLQPAQRGKVELVARMGPGETWMRLWRVPFPSETTRPVAWARVTGTGADGRPFAIDLGTDGKVVGPEATGPESRALLKAVTIACEVQALRDCIAFGRVYGQRSYGEVMGAIRSMAADVREAQRALSDPEFARDLEALEAAARLPEPEIERVRREHPHGCCGFDLPLPVKIVALPFVIVAFLLFG